MYYVYVYYVSQIFIQIKNGLLNRDHDLLNRDLGLLNRNNQMEISDD